MSPKELVERNSIFLEDLQRWVVPLEVVEQALQIKTAKELEDNLSKLGENMEELNKIFNSLGNKLND